MPLTRIDRAVQAAMAEIAEVRRQHLLRETIRMRQLARRVQRDAVTCCGAAVRLQHREDRVA